jgi:hypothetical protein
MGLQNPSVPSPNPATPHTITGQHANMGRSLDMTIPYDTSSQIPEQLLAEIGHIDACSVNELAESFLLVSHESHEHGGNTPTVNISWSRV